MNLKASRDCPKSEAIVRLLMGELDQEASRRVFDHVLSCPFCRPRMQVLRKVKVELESRAGGIPEAGLTKKETRALRGLAAEELSRLKRPTRPRLLRPLPAAAAAAVVVAALGAGYLYLQNAVHMSVTRGSAGGSLSLNAPGDQLSKAPAVFTWSEVPGRDDFRFLLISENLDTIYELDTHATAVDLPEAARQKLQTGRTYLWSVLALDSAGRELASASREFVIE